MVDVSISHFNAVDGQSPLRTAVQKPRLVVILLLIPTNDGFLCTLIGDTRNLSGWCVNHLSGSQNGYVSAGEPLKTVAKWSATMIVTHQAWWATPNLLFLPWPLRTCSFKWRLRGKRKACVRVVFP